MALHQLDCDVCRQIELCRENRHPRFLARMQSGYAVLGPHQFFTGYSLLLCEEPVTELDELEPLMRRQLLEDMSTLALAVRRVVHPHKLNYEALGNVCPHVHWHIFPRFTSEPEPYLPVWNVMPEGEAMAPFLFDPQMHSDVLEALREELGNQFH
ncbi:MAG: HIT domain-containing protein [Armatimonadetes bacterium]|nr:HIT domain-containing protein [Armatimonadota bacterium]